MSEQQYRLDLIVDTSHIEAGTEQKIEIQPTFGPDEAAAIDLVLDVIEIRAPGLIERHWWEAAG